MKGTENFYGKHKPAFILLPCQIFRFKCSVKFSLRNCFIVSEEVRRLPNMSKFENIDYFLNTEFTLDLMASHTIGLQVCNTLFFFIATIFIRTLRLRFAPKCKKMYGLK